MSFSTVFSGFMGAAALDTQRLFWRVASVGKEQSTVQLSSTNASSTMGSNANIATERHHQKSCWERKSSATVCFEGASGSAVRMGSVRFSTTVIFLIPSPNIVQYRQTLLISHRFFISSLWRPMSKGQCVRFSEHQNRLKQSAGS